MAYSRRTGRSRSTLILLILGSLTLLVIGLPDSGPVRPIRSAFGTVFSPFRAAGRTVFSPVADAWHGAFGYEDVKKENEKLRKRIADLKGEQVRDKVRAEQIRDLRELANKLHLDQKQYPIKTAEVTSGPLSSFDRTITIGVGSGDGIKKDQAVITGDGLVGRVSSVRAGSATVSLITEPSLSVGVKVQRTRDVGILNGQGQGRDLVIDDGIPIKSKVRKGDLVVTSGTDRSLYPRDVVVGRVTKVKRSVDGTQLVAEVAPAVNLSSVTYVAVVRLEAQ